MVRRLATDNMTPAQQAMADIAQYLLLEGEADDGAHTPVAGWLWWALNPNSVDVGGLVCTTTSSWFAWPSGSKACNEHL